jgi:predicted transcriptional regulator
MPKFTIYLDEETARDLARRAKVDKLSKSRVVANALKETTGRKPNAEARKMPDAEVRRRLAELGGSMPDFPSLEEIRSSLWGQPKR